MSDSPIEGWRKQAREDAAKALRSLAVELDADGHPAMAAIYREQADDIDPAVPAESFESALMRVAAAMRKAGSA